MATLDRVVVSRVTRSFGATVALRGVDAQFLAREITTLEGHNGSGKSTLLGILGTLLSPTAGKVIYGSDDLVSSEIRKQIGWVSHDTRCYPDLTARENVKLAASLYGVSPSTGWDAMSERFGVKRFADSPVRQLSRGQRQRVTLARALVHRPALLLLDEPTTGLDTEGISRLLEVIEEERVRGCIVVLVTHDVQIAERVATRRIVLERGRVQVAEAPREAAPAP